MQPGGGCSGTSHPTGQQTSRCLTIGLTGNRSSANPTHHRFIKGCWQQGVRDECLNINTCSSLTHARVVITDWKDEYNHHRRHSALGYEAPDQFMICSASQNRVGHS